ncbi:MAG TPA: hypothetical protein VEK79_25700 [Thermoanaerobaculia bacterium]|nr:hypothetical protein [Thermoanaerobaculia bacterium]
MCNQAVCLLAAEIERRGIATVCVILLREVAEKVRPPRALAVPFPHGYPLGAPHDAVMQRAVMLAALRLLERSTAPPVLADY